MYVCLILFGLFVYIDFIRTLSTLIHSQSGVSAFSMMGIRQRKWVHLCYKCMYVKGGSVQSMYLYKLTRVACYILTRKLLPETQMHRETVHTLPVSINKVSKLVMFSFPSALVSTPTV